MINFTTVKQNKYLLIALLVTILMVLSPSLDLILRKDIAWGDKFTFLANVRYGSSYYNTRIREIKEGNIFIGNPYFLEHNKTLAPAFFVADWIAAIPYLSGFSYNFTMIFNVFWWSLVFVFLSYLILRSLRLSKRISAIGSIIIYSQGFPLMMTPVSMQIVFPFYLLFLLSFILWIEKPFDKKRTGFLIASAAASFYIYTYLWQIVLVFLFLNLLFFIIIKHKKRVFYLLGIIFVSLLLSTPLILYTIKQIMHPDYWDTMFRIGLELNRLPMAEAYYSGRWVFLVILLWSLSLYRVKSFREESSQKSVAIFFIISGLSLLFVALSNVITGRDLELPGHIVRFIIIWLPLSLVVYLALLFRQFRIFKNIQISRRLILITILFLSLCEIIYFSKSYFSSTKSGVVGESAKFFTYVAPLLWLEKNEAKAVVIWIDPKDELQTYIPMLTKHYLLFGFGGVLHLVSSREIEERYLTASYFKNLTQANIEEDFKIYAGIGNAVHPHKTYNRKVRLCRLLHLSKLGFQCGELTDAVSFKGKEYFNNLYQEYINEIKPNINQELRKFHVSYIIQNKQLDPAHQIEYHIKEIKGAYLVYSDDIFSIFKIDN